MIIFLKRPLLSSERNLLQSVYHWLKKYQKNIFKSEEEYKKFMYFTHQDVIRKSLDGSRSIQGDLGILKLLSTSVGMSQLELWNLLLILYQVENRIRSCDFDSSNKKFYFILGKKLSMYRLCFCEVCLVKFLQVYPWVSRYYLRVKLRVRF